MGFLLKKVQVIFVRHFVFFCVCVDCCIMGIYSTALDFSLKNDIGTI